MIIVMIVKHTHRKIVLKSYDVTAIERWEKIIFLFLCKWNNLILQPKIIIVKHNIHIKIVIKSHNETSIKKVRKDHDSLPGMCK